MEISSNQGKWLSIMEYSASKNKSISTIRRYIKSERLRFKSENGKYFIWVSDKSLNKDYVQNNELMKLKFENEHLQMRIKELKEENDDLKMLVTIYESKKNNNQVEEVRYN